MSAALTLLAGVAEKIHYKDYFASPETLQSICQNVRCCQAPGPRSCWQVIVPNLMLRAVDLEVFEDDPDEYIRRDIEGSGAQDVGAGPRTHPCCRH